MLKFVIVSKTYCKKDIYKVFMDDIMPVYKKKDLMMINKQQVEDLIL